MSKFARFALISAALASATLGAVAPATARDRYHDDAAALGLFGLAAGVVAGAAIAGQPRYVEPDYLPPPPPPVYYPPRAVYVTEYPEAPVAVGVGVEPWSPEWYRYCATRYRSFSPEDGTYIGFDGRAHFCTAG